MINNTASHKRGGGIPTGKLRALCLELVPLVPVCAAVHDQLERRAVLARLLARDNTLEVVRRGLPTVEYVFCFVYRWYNLSEFVN